MAHYFGTDGFRGEVNRTLTAMHAYQIGRFLGWYFATPLSGTSKGHKPRLVIGKDTRLSGYMFEYAIGAGITASGADAYLLHVTTTPCVSFVTAQEDFDCGIMISASHNPFCDNGIKLVNRHGEKIDDATIDLIEAYLDGNLSALGIEDDLPLATGAEVGRIVDYAVGRNRYIGYLISLASHSFKGKRIGLDCANGSAWWIAKAVFDALGAKTYLLHAEPNGLNINQNAGSTHIEGLKKFVVENNLDAGFAYDGDADRCLAVDELGNLINGDQILYIFAAQAQKTANFSGKVVATVMSNMGLFKSLEQLGIEYEITRVGDRYVYEKMVENNHMIGGEQSGHIILRKYATTGDGILTSIMLTEAMIDQKASLFHLAKPMEIYPQVLVNLRVEDKDRIMDHPAVQASVKAAEELLAGSGRVLLRKSGTEPVIRVMAEASTHELCNDAVELICRVILENASH